MRKINLVFAAALLLGCGDDVANSQSNSDGGVSLTPNDDASATVLNIDTPPVATGTLTYHNGPVQINPVKLYLVWYGNWDWKTIQLINDFASNYRQSSLYQTNTAFYEAEADVDGGQLHASTTLDFAGNLYDMYGFGNTLSQSNVLKAIEQAVGYSNLAWDYNAIYILLTSKDVQVAGFCSVYCAYHNFTNELAADGFGVQVKFAFAGDPMQCPSSCTNQDVYQALGLNNSPNDNWSADALANILAHEINESISDPLHPLGWTTNDLNQYESGDLCQSRYGDLYRTNNGSAANINFGGHDWLLHKNMTIKSDGTQECALKPE
jgi:hypothetical protein